MDLPLPPFLPSAPHELTRPAGGQEAQRRAPGFAWGRLRHEAHPRGSAAAARGTQAGRDSAAPDGSGVRGIPRCADSLSLDLDGKCSIKIQFGAFRLPPSLSPPSLFPSPPVADVAAVNHVPIDRLWPAPPGPTRSSRPRPRAHPTVHIGETSRGHRPPEPRTKGPVRPSPACQACLGAAPGLAACRAARCSGAIAGWGGDPQPRRLLPAPVVPALPTACQGVGPGAAARAGGPRWAQATLEVSLARWAGWVRDCGTLWQEPRLPGRGDGEKPAPGGGHGSGRVGSLQQLPRPCCIGSQTACLPPVCGPSSGVCLPKSPGSGIQGSPSSPDCDRDPRALFWPCAPPARSPRTFQPRAPPARGSQRQAKHPNQVDNPRVLSQLNGPLQLCCRDYQNTHATTLPQRCSRGCPSCAERPLASTRGRNVPKAPALPPLATPIATAPPLHT